MALSISSLNWTAFNFLTGAILLDSAQVTLGAGGDLTDVIGQVSTTTVTLNLDSKTPSPDWVFATEKGTAAWVAWTGDTLNPVIVWGGIVTQRVRGLGPQVTLQLATPEAYLEGCPVGTYTASSVNQDTILNQLVTNFASGANRPSWQLIPSGTPSTATQSITYTAPTNTNVLQALQALSATSPSAGVSGPEWIAGWQWNLSAGTILPTITYGQRIGHVAPASGPNVTFELADMLDGSQFTEDYTAGRGANQVTALGVAAPGSNTVPSATVTASSLAGRALWNYTYTPNSTVSDVPTLTNYATKALAALSTGNQPIAIVIDIAKPGKALGVDWFIGDDVGYYLAGAIQFPIPISGTGRVIGTKIMANGTVTPIIQGAVLS